MGKFVITKRTNGEYQFNLKATNGQNILNSEGYAAKSGCQNGIQSVKENAGNQARYESITAKDDRVYFVLKATNGQVIGTSQMYQDSAGCIIGISSVMTNAPDAETEDLSNE